MNPFAGPSIAMTMLAATAQIAPADRAAILDAARVPVSARLGKPVLFRVNHIARQGDWAFLYADMQGPGGAPIDLADTPLADGAAEGMASRSCAVLLHHSGGGWKAVDSAVGPTDVAWEGWAARHKAPPAIFRF